MNGIKINIGDALGSFSVTGEKTNRDKVGVGDVFGTDRYVEREWTTLYICIGIDEGSAIYKTIQVDRDTLRISFRSDKDRHMRRDPGYHVYVYGGVKARCIFSC